MAIEQFNKELSDAELKAKQKATWAAGIVATIAVIALFLVFRFAGAEQDRDVNALKVQMSVVVENQASAIEQFRQSQYSVIRDLSENTTLQLFLTQAKEQSASDLPEVDYVRNLLVSRAKDAGFYQAQSDQDVTATLENNHPGAVILTDDLGKPLVSVGNRPTVLTEEDLTDLIAAKSPYGVSYEDLQTHLPMMAYVLPIRAVQAEAVAAPKIGYIIGLKDISAELAQVFARKGLGVAGEEHLLVRKEANQLVYLLGEKQKDSFFKTLGEGADTVSRLALNEPGSFGQGLDYQGQKVFYASSLVGKLPNWVFVYKVPVDTAMHESEGRRAKVVTILILLVIIVLAVLVATWRHATSQKLEEALERVTDLAQRFEDQKNMLHLVTDNQPRNIFIYDLNEKLRFANTAVARSFGLKEEELTGKSVEAIFGPNPGKRYIVRGREAIETGSPVIAIERQKRNGLELILQIQHVPLEESSVAPAGILVVEEDITTAVLEREHREKTMRQLVDTLVTLVDKRDPYAAGHSLRVGRIAKEIAFEMDLEEDLVETAEIAGSVMNLGKIVVPPEILTKPGDLTDKEKLLVRNSIRTAADILSVVDFDGPVVKTLRQVQEKVDGTGAPEGWRGEDIIITARILSVANAFVALISPRAHRPGMGLDEAFDQLQQQVGSSFDRRVVAALVSFIENHGGREEWEKEAAKAQKSAPSKNNPADEVADNYFPKS